MFTSLLYRSRGTLSQKSSSVVRFTSRTSVSALSIASLPPVRLTSSRLESSRTSGPSCSVRRVKPYIRWHNSTRRNVAAESDRSRRAVTCIQASPGVANQTPELSSKINLYEMLIVSTGDVVVVSAAIRRSSSSQKRMRRRRRRRRKMLGSINSIISRSSISSSLQLQRKQSRLMIRT